MDTPTKAHPSIADMRTVISAPGAANPIKPHDAFNTSVVGQTVGFQSVYFRYNDTGGPSNLAPGRPVTMTSSLAPPAGANHAIVMLSGIGFAYVDGNDNISDHHLGVVDGKLFFPQWGTVAAYFVMRDNSDSEGVDCYVNGLVLYFS